MKTMARMPAHSARVLLQGPRLNIIDMLHTLCNFSFTFNSESDKWNVFQSPISQLITFDDWYCLLPTENSRNENMKGNSQKMACFRSRHLFILVKDFWSTKNHPIYFNRTIVYHFEMIVIILRTKEMSKVSEHGKMYFLTKRNEAT